LYTIVTEYNGPLEAAGTCAAQLRHSGMMLNTWIPSYNQDNTIQFIYDF